MSNKRITGLDVLRLLSMYMICVLHILKKGGILSSITFGTGKYVVLWVLETICFCAVNVYALLSGYLYHESKNRLAKLLKLWLQVFFYSFIISVILHFLGFKMNTSIKNILMLMAPLITRKYWYFNAFVGMYLLSPIIAKGVDSIDMKQAKKYVYLLPFVFCFLGLPYDAFYTYKGYSTMWIILLFIIGMLIKKTDSFQSISNWKLCLIFVISTTISMIPKILINNENYYLINYISPTIVVNAIVLLILFSRLQINNDIVSRFSKYAFGIYLFQLNRTVWRFLDNRFAFIAKFGTINSFFAVLGFACVLFVVGVLVEILRVCIFKLLRIDNLVDKLCEKINNYQINKANKT